MFKSNIKYATQTKGAIGEMYLTIRLLLLGHDVANTNFTVKNTAYYDLLCRKDGTGKAYPLQVKTTFSNSFRVGMSHSDFIDENGCFDKIKGRKHTEQKYNVHGPLLNVTELSPIQNLEFSF